MPISAAITNQNDAGFNPAINCQSACFHACLPYRRLRSGCPAAGSLQRSNSIVPVRVGCQHSRHHARCRPTLSPSSAVREALISASNFSTADRGTGTVLIFDIEDSDSPYPATISAPAPVHVGSTLVRADKEALPASSSIDTMVSQRLPSRPPEQTGNPAATKAGRVWSTVTASCSGLGNDSNFVTLPEA